MLTDVDTTATVKLVDCSHNGWSVFIYSSRKPGKGGTTKNLLGRERICKAFGHKLSAATWFTLCQPLNDFFISNHRVAATRTNNLGN